LKQSLRPWQAFETLRMSDAARLTVIKQAKGEHYPIESVLWTMDW
jgi:hypothetical protein